MSERHEHAGHRQRLYTRLAASGLDSFQPHEALELLLFYVIPYRDVNALAHQLIDRFGSLKGVLNAPSEQLLEFKGVGEETAKFLAVMRYSVEGYLAGSEKPLPVIATLKQLADYFGSWLHDNHWNMRFLTSLSSESRLLDVAPLEHDEGEGELRKAVECALRHRASRVVLVQYRPDDALEFSQEYLDFARNFVAAMTALEVETSDCVLITREGYTSLRKTGVLRESGLGFRETYVAIDRWLADEINM